MSCPTCDHTMQQLPTETQRFFWCPRCGTISFEASFGGESHTPPKLVERCREFAVQSPMVSGDPKFLSGRLWRELGIAEAINRPEERSS